MSSNNDIGSMFDKKNKDIFLEKLQIDLDNNTDGLKQATKYKVVMEYSQLSSFLKKIFVTYRVEFDDKKLRKFLGTSLNNISEMIKSLIDKRRDDNKKYIFSDKKIDNEYIRNYHSNIDESSRSFKESLNIKIRQEVCINLYESLNTFVVFPNDEIKDIILDKCSSGVAPSLIKKITDDLMYKDLSLKNMSVESFNEYLNKVAFSDKFSKEYAKNIGVKDLKKYREET